MQACLPLQFYKVSAAHKPIISNGTTQNQRLHTHQEHPGISSQNAKSLRYACTKLKVDVFTINLQCFRMLACLAHTCTDNGNTCHLMWSSSLIRVCKQSVSHWSALEMFCCHANRDCESVKLEDLKRCRTLLVSKIHMKIVSRSRYWRSICLSRRLLCVKLAENLISKNVSYFWCQSIHEPCIWQSLCLWKCAPHLLWHILPPNSCVTHSCPNNLFTWMAYNLKAHENLRLS